MTSIDDYLSQAMTSARRMKELRVRQVKGKPGHTDMSLMIECWRGQSAVACVFVRPDSSQALARVVNVIARGFSVDMLVLTMEAYTAAATTVKDINPDTGREWGSGDMAEYFEKHGPSGTVSECLLMQVYNRAGDIRSGQLTYKIAGKNVIWADDPMMATEDPAQSGGPLQDAVARIMRESTVAQTFAHPEVDAERLHALAERATIEFLHDQKIDIDILMITPLGSPRGQILRETLPASALRNPADWN